jgi:hypothetical protein
MNLRALADWIAQRIADERGVWPWAERNQGLLSVAALVIALAIAVYEVRRAARSESRLVIEYVDWVLNCADRSIELTKDAIGTMEGRVTGIDAMSLPVWRLLSGNAIATLEEIQPLRPTHPRLAHHVNRLLRCMAIEVAGDDATPEALALLRQILDMLEASRTHVVRLRPKGKIAATTF